MENGHLYVRDQGSNNGTSIDGNAIAAGNWTPVRHGGVLRFGPIELTVRLE
jgi:predicted component of type VI protein secretion system